MNVIKFSGPDDKLEFMPPSQQIVFPSRVGAQTPGSANGSASGKHSLIVFCATSPIAITVFAFLIRLFITLVFRTYTFPANAGENAGRFASEIGGVAQSIADGRGFSSPYGGDTGPTALVSPVFAYFLAGVFKILGAYSHASALTVVIFDSLCSALTCLPIFALARHTFDRNTALAAAWFWAFSPFAIHASTAYVWETCLSTLLMAVAFAMAMWLDQHRPIKMWLLFGFLWGVIALSNASLIAPFPFILGWIVMQRKLYSAALLRFPAVAALATLLCISPWAVRNYITFRSPVFLRSGLSGDGLYTAVMADTAKGRECAYGMVNCSEGRREYRRMGEKAYMASRGQIATGIISRHPAHYLFLSAQRAWFFWTGDWAHFNRFVGRAMVFRFGLYAVLSALGIAGLFVAIRKRLPCATLYAIPLLVYPMIYYFTQVQARYRHPIEPYLVILASYAITRWARPSPDAERGVSLAA